MSVVFKLAASFFSQPGIKKQHKDCLVSEISRISRIECVEDSLHFFIGEGRHNFLADFGGFRSLAWPVSPNFSVTNQRKHVGFECGNGRLMVTVFLISLE